jgi:hypothetical protein
LLDSATVMRAMWSDANQWLVDYYHEALMEERVTVTDAVLDSAYAADGHRLLDHILVRTTPNMAPPDRVGAKRRADRLQQLAASGRWANANEESDDPVARRAGGRLGVVERGERDAAFDAVAFALGPGEVSAVFETKAGYHILRRPSLDDVREAFATEVADILMARTDTVILAEIEDEWRVRVVDNAPSLMREAAAAPLRAFQRPQQLGSHREADFTTVDFLRWLQAMSTVVYLSVPGASDEQLEDLLRSLVRNEALVAAALKAGVELQPEDMTELRERLREEIEAVRVGVGLDSTVMGRPTREERLTAAERAVHDYFRRLAASEATVVVVPAFLAQALRQDMPWDVSQTAIDAGLERLVALRQERFQQEVDSLRARRAAPGTVEAGDSAP